MKFWAVLGSRGCREKNLTTAISMQFLGCFFQLFVGNIFFKNLISFFAHKKLKKPPQKVLYLWQLGGFFLCSPDCPKQPRTSFPFYNFFIQPSLLESLVSFLINFDSIVRLESRLFILSYLFQLIFGTMSWTLEDIYQNLFPMIFGFRNKIFYEHVKSISKF